MIATVSGPPGSGKTTASRLLSEKLGYPLVYVGNIFREMAKERGMSLADFTVRITAGSSLPTNRIFKQQLYMEMYSMGMVDRTAALENSDLPHAKEVAERMDKREMEMVKLGSTLKGGK